MRSPAHTITAAALSIGLLFLLPAAAQAKVKITVDLDTQSMHVDGKDRSFDWKVSTGKTGYETPSGAYRVLWMDKDHHSDEYEQAPMPNSIFFAPGFAIHGFGRSPWGHAASHGCVRLPVAKSAILFEMVKAEGADVQIIGGSPANKAVASRITQEKEARKSYASEQGNDPGGYEQQGGTRQPDVSGTYNPAPRDPRNSDGRGYIARGYGSDEAPQAPVAQEGGNDIGRSLFGLFQ